jgi:hypothetical protein
MKLLTNKKFFVLSTLVVGSILVATIPTFAKDQAEEAKICPDVSQNSTPGWFEPTEEQYKSDLYRARTYGETNLAAWWKAGFNYTVRALVSDITGLGSPEGSQTGGAIGGVAKLIAVLYTTPPVSSREYLAHLGQNLGLIKPTYAQGLGYRGLTPVLSLWLIMRNIAYLGFVIIFVVIGFMVIMRQRIDPRTVVTVQDSLPRIVVALLLVTFSYAIVGFLIDFSEFSIALIASSFSQFHQYSGAPTKFGDWLKTIRITNIFELIWALNRSENIVPVFGAILESTNITTFLTTLFDLLGITKWVPELIISFAVLGAMFKVFFLLVGSYVSLLISTIFSPFILLVSALPGKANSALDWLKGILVNILVFPATFGFLFLGAIIINASGEIWKIKDGSVNFGEAPWVPFGLGGFMLEGETMGQAMQGLIALGIILTTPKVGEAVKGAITGKGMPVGGEAAEALRGAAKKIIPFV